MIPKEPPLESRLLELALEEVHHPEMLYTLVIKLCTLKDRAQGKNKGKICSDKKIG